MLINVIATLGWVVGIALILLVGAFIFRMFITIRKVKNDFGFFLSLAACVALSFQFITGILANFNLFPLMSISIPFVSYSGTGYIVSMAFVGLILSVWRRNKMLSANEKLENSKQKNLIYMQDGKLIVDLGFIKK